MKNEQDPKVLKLKPISVMFYQSGLLLALRVSVCVSVCLSVCVISSAETDGSILMKPSTNNFADICH